MVFEENPYNTVTDHPIQNDLLITEGENLSVQIPSINCILGDKLTAFAPHTTGIPLGVGKDLEVIKLMYDCATLFQAMNDFPEVKEVYGNVVQKELGYRGLSLRQEDVLADTIKSCFCIMGRGSINKDEYPAYADGITRIQGHIFSGTFNGEWAGVHAASVLYLASAILTGQNDCIPTSDESPDSSDINKVKHIRRIKYIQKIDPDAYNYVTETYRMIGYKQFILE